MIIFLIFVCFVPVLFRLPIICVPIPGETKWSSLGGNTESNGERTILSDSRKRGYASETGDCEIEDYRGCAGDDAELAKKTKGERDMDFSTEALFCIDQTETPVHTATHPNLAVKSPCSGSCIVKFYEFKQSFSSTEDSDSDVLVSTLKLNDMIEIIGIYAARGSVDCCSLGEQVDLSDSQVFDVFTGFEDLDPAVQFVNYPIVHCINYRRLCSAFPLLVPVYVAVSDINAPSPLGYALNMAGNPFITVSKPITNFEFNFKEALSMIYQRLTHALAGDYLSAEFIAMSIISRVISRHHGSVVGPLSLNICGVLPDDPRISALIETLENIVPRLTTVWTANKQY